MGIQQIIDYVMKTPENTNPAVLRSVIKQNTSSSSGGGEDLTPFLDGTIETVTIPNEVEALREGTFYNCTLLKSIDAASDHPTYSAVDGILYSKDGATLISYPAGKEETEFTIPESVKSVGVGLLAGCKNLTKVIIPETITEISDHMMQECNSISEFVIPNHITRIGSAAFMSCTNLKNITIPNSVKVIDSSAFQNSGLETVIIPDGVERIENSAFAYCSSLTNITIPASVVFIDNGTQGDLTHAFYNCSESLVIHGYTGSAAETYAAEFGITFEAITE